MSQNDLKSKRRLEEFSFFLSVSVSILFLRLAILSVNYKNRFFLKNHRCTFYTSLNLRSFFKSRSNNFLGFKIFFIHFSLGVLLIPTLPPPPECISGRNDDNWLGHEMWTSEKSLKQKK